MTTIEKNEVICVCGNIIKLDYDKAVEVIIKPSKGIEEKMYQFRCSHCGQTYIKEIPTPIYFDLPLN